MPSTVPIRITIVEMSGCPHCDAARAVIAAEIAARPDLRVEVTRLDAAAPEGARLVAEHRAPQSPLVLVDGEFLSSGRLRAAALRRRLPAAAVAR